MTATTATPVTKATTETLQDIAAASQPLMNHDVAKDAAAVGDAAANLVGTYSDALTTYIAYIELLAIGASIGFALVIGYAINRLINRQFTKIDHSASWRWILKPLELLPALFSLVFINVTKVIVQPLVGTPVFIYPASQIVLTWLLIQAVHMLIKSKIMAWFLSIIAALMIGLETFGLLAPISQLLKNIGFKIGTSEITMYGIVHGLIICVIVFWLARASSKRIERQLRDSSINYNIRELLIKFSKIFIYFIALLATLNAIGVDLTAFAVFGGALGVGIGLGLQKITANFVSGVTLLLEKSIRQGDLIQVDGVHGYVRALNIRYTLVETFSGQEVSIPNETLTSKNIINWTMSNARARIEIPVGVAYGTDYKLVQRLMTQAAKEYPRTLDDPEIICVMREFGDFSVNFLLQFWVDDVKDGLQIPQSDVMFKIAELFQEHHITIPFPKRDVYLHHSEAPTKTAD